MLVVVMEQRTYSQRKNEYFTKIVRLVDEYPNLLVVGADNVGSNQMQQIRRALRGKAILLMGKNVCTNGTFATSPPPPPPIKCRVESTCS
jgi:ribosomal protein L10